MHPLRVGGSVSKSLAGTIVDEIVKIRRWETERVASYYIGVDNLYTGPTFKEKTDHGYTGP